MRILVGHAKLVTPAGAMPPERGRPYEPGYLLHCLCGWEKGIVRCRQLARDVYRSEHLAPLRAAARETCRVCTKPITIANATKKVGICKSCERDRTTAWAKANPDRYREHQQRSHYRRRYDIDLSTYNEMLVSQDGRCAICKRHVDETTGGGPRRLFVDHDHATGAIRGLLCFMCNTALGLFRDDPALLRNAADYIEVKPCAH